MDRHYRWLTVALMANMVLIGVCAGAAIHDYHPPFDDWLWRWSTLLAGILAVLAAGATVVAMMWTDERQAKRHEQNIMLLRRPDTLKVLRAFDPNARNLTGIANRLRNCFDRLSSLRELEKVHMKMIEILVNDLHDAIEDEAIRDAKSLFNGSMFERHQLLRYHSDSLSKLVPRLPYATDTFVLINPSDGNEFEAFVAECHFVAKQLDKFVLDLTKLAREYGITDHSANILV